ncbi:MAG: succinate dehydrogenase iron-sulfur subunit, partial [Vulcanisaeta sp.]|nr:succinate dehydrogenase iron-sulfur subunit [Vulcanisaeta sp.]
CHVAYSCSVVCPKNVDPGFAIQLLKAAILKRRKKL